MIQTSTLIIGALDDEREFALKKYGAYPRPVGEHLLLVEQYVKDAKTAWTRYSGDDRALHELRKAGAMILQCLSEHGCPFRGQPFANSAGQEDLPTKS
jgi:hypothetical protein